MVETNPQTIQVQKPVIPTTASSPSKPAAPTAAPTAAPVTPIVPRQMISIPLTTLKSIHDKAGMISHVAGGTAKVQLAQEIVALCEGVLK